MMERSQFSVQLANYNKHHKKTSSDSFNYQIPYKIGPVVSSNKTILKNSELFHSYDSTTSISTEGLYTKKSSLLINDKLSSNKAATLNDSRYVTKVDISIEGESSQQFVTTIPIASHKVDSQNNSVLSVGKEVPTIYIVEGDDAKLKGRIPEDSSSVKRDIKLVDGVREQCSTHLPVNENVCSLKSKPPTTENIDQNGNSNDFHNSSQQDTDYKIDLTYNSKCVSDTKSIKYKLDDATQSDNQVDNADDLIGDYNTCSCCSEEIYIVHHSNEIDVLQPNIKGEVECLDVVNSSFNYLKESKSSENLSLYSFIANEERETDIHVGDKYGYSGLEDRDHDSDIHLDVQNSNTTAYRSHDRIESAYTDFKSSYTSDGTLNEDQNDNDASNKVTSDSTEDYNRRDNLVKEGYLKCALSDHDNNTNKIDCLGVKEESVLNSTENVDNPILYEEVKAKCERHKIIGSDRENENSINNLNGYNEGIRTEKDLEYTENQPKKTNLAAPDIIISNCVIEDNMAGKTASKNHQPDIISIPERTKLMMNSNSLDCDENWNIAKQKKTKKILTLPPKIKESVLEEDVEENQLELGKNRLLHVPVSNKVLIPVILKDPSPPQLLKKRKTGVVENNTDLDELKEMARKLNLSTRRPSYLMWKERLKSNTLSANQGCLNKDSSVDKGNGDALGTEDSATNTRMESLTQTLAWLRRELIEMRSQDQVLARTLLRLRQDIREFKLQRSCAEHQEILEDAIDLEEEKDLLGELSCDYIQESFSPTLKNVGVTRMHIGRRRFSVF